MGSHPSKQQGGAHNREKRAEGSAIAELKGKIKWRESGGVGGAKNGSCVRRLLGVCMFVTQGAPPGLGFK